MYQKVHCSAADRREQLMRAHREKMKALTMERQQIVQHQALYTGKVDLTPQVRDTKLVRYNVNLVSPFKPARPRV